MNNKTILKNLPLLTLFAASLVLSPAIAVAGQGDRSHSRAQYSHDDHRSHGKGHNRSGKHSNKHNYRSHGKSHKGNNWHRSTNRYDNGHGHHKGRAYYKRGHDNHRHDHRTTYVVNDHHYNDRLYGLDHLRFMIGLHTDNFDITFRD